MAIDEPPSRRKPSSPSTTSEIVARRTSSRVNVSSKKRKKGPIAQLAFWSFALPSRSAERPSKSRRLTSLASVAPTIAPLEATASATSGSGLFQREALVEPGVVAGSDSRHRLALGEHLGVGANADFQILRPGAGLHQRILEPHRRGRARLESAEIIAQNAHDLLARLRRAFTAAARALFDDALEQGFREGHAGRFDRLQVDRRKQMRARSGLGCREEYGRGCR